jgi:hypothetical protein
MPVAHVSVPVLFIILSFFYTVSQNFARDQGAIADRRQRFG